MLMEAYHKAYKISPLAFILKVNSLEQALETLENNSNMIVIFMAVPDHTSLSEILNVSCHVSGEQIDNMQQHLNSVIEWSKDEDII